MVRVRDWLCSSFSRRSQALELEDEALVLWLTLRDGLVVLASIACLCVVVEEWQGPDFYFDNVSMASALTKRQFEPSNLSSRAEERRIGLLLPDFSGISTVPMVWDWLDACVVPAFAVPEPRVLVSNRLLGKVRLRQVRVRDGTCALRELFDGVFAVCYGPYSDENENKGHIGPEGGGGGAGRRTETAWEWNSAGSLGGTSFQGEVATYGGGGFYADLPRDHDQAVALLGELRDGRWIDEATRMVFVDINMYNPDHNVFVLANVYIEILPTAGLLPRVSVNTLKLVTDAHCHVVAHVLLLALSLWTALMQAAELAARGAAGYFLVIAHYMHIAALVLGVIVSVSGVVGKCRDPDPSTDPALVALASEEFVDLMSVRYAYDYYRYTTILLLFLSCGRLLFLSDFGAHSKLTAALRRSLGKMFPFSLMFIILMCSFSMLAYLVFGTDLYDFRTFQNSLVVLVEVIIGQLDYQSLSTTNRFLGPLFYMAFIFFVVFVLYNMFIVILNDTYYIVRGEAPTADDVVMYRVVPFVTNCLANLWRLLRVPLTLPKARPPPPRVVKLRALRTLLLDCKVPRRAVADFMWQLSGGGSSELVDREQAAQLAARATQDLWQEPASWEYFMNLWHRLREVERSVRVLDRALDELLQDLR